MRMKEKLLLKIALICSILGLLILYFISDNIELDLESVEKINLDSVGSDAKIIGKISRISNLEKVTFIELEQPQTIDVVVFKEKNLTLNQGDDIEIIGEIEEYNGELEIIANRIRVLK